jgi:hypothetical protein
MNNKYNVIKTPAEKVTVFISRHQLWKNFIASWTDLAWNDYTIGTSCVKEVADVLLTGKPLTNKPAALRGLFKDGWTFMLMCDAMSELDSGKDNLLEIVVTDGNDNPVIVPHEDIQF